MRAFPQNCSMGSTYQKHFFIGALKFFWNFRKTSRKKSTQKQSFSGVLQDRCPGKICKFHKKTPVLRSIKRLQHRCFCEFFEAFKNAFFTKHLWWSWGLSLKRFYIGGVHKKVFEILQSFTKYLRLTLVSMWNNAQREKFYFCVQEVFASIDKIFILAVGLGTRLPV